MLSIMYIVQFVRILLKFIIWCTHYIIFINLQYNWNISAFNYNYMKYNSKSGIESRMKNGFSVMNVILRRAKYKFMTSSDTSVFVKSESEYYLSDRNENGFNHTSAYISLTLSRRLDAHIYIRPAAQEQKNSVQCTNYTIEIHWQPNPWIQPTPLNQNSG